MAPSIPSVTLNNGEKIPVIGLGTWKSKPGEVGAAVKTAIDIGYRHFDCAHIYGNEKEIGDAIKEKMTEGVVKREDLFITSKLWNTFHSPSLVEPALKTTLSNLGLAYLDLYLIHWPTGFKEGTDDLFPMNEAKDKLLASDVDYLDTYKAMEETVKKGLTRSIGLSNFNEEQTDRILSAATIKPVTNQVECHPYLNQIRLAEFSKARGIVLTSYSPLGSPDRPWAKPEDPKLLDDPSLVAIAKRLGRTPAQVVIRYQIQLGNIPIPKSVSASRMKENFNVFDFELSAEDMKVMNSFDRKDGRVCFLAASVDHKYFPFKISS